MQVRKLKDALGAEIRGTKLAALDDASFAQLLAAWRAHGALLVRDQEDMTDAQFEAFSKRERSPSWPFGAIGHSTKHRMKDLERLPAKASR